MELWAVTMVKDEIDVIEYTLRHLASEGVDGIIVADNGSTDGTFELLKGYERQSDLGCHFMLLQDDEVGYYQSRKMTTLVDVGRQMGADWVIPFDADELWFSKLGSLKQTVESIDGDRHPVLGAELYNYFPRSTNKYDENPFVRIIDRDREAGPLPKVLVRALDGMFIHQGNHGATAPGAIPHYAPSTLRVAHFPWRSYGQFEKKIRNGYAAYLATDLPEAMGAHWRGYGETLERGGSEALRAHYEKWFQDPELPTVVDPAPYRRFR